jgi:glycosyltransferase involved in cell wall biosynthesis
MFKAETDFNKMDEHKNHQPLVSVIIPFYDREDFLREAIESIIFQSFTDWELILIDDGSTDNSAAIAKKFVQKYPNKVFLIEHENHKNRGASASRNLGILHSQGEFITFLDSDDVYFFDTLERELKCFENCPQAHAVCGTLQFWYSWGSKKVRNQSEFTVNLGLKINHLHSAPTLLIHNLKSLGRKPSINSIMIRRDFLNQVGAFEDDFLQVSEDQVFWSKISLRGNIFIMDDCLAKYRQHPMSSTQIAINNNHDIADWKVFLDWLEKYLAKQEISNQELWQALKISRRENYYQKKFSILKKLYRYIFPLRVRYWVRDQIIRWRT